MGYAIWASACCLASLSFGIMARRVAHDEEQSVDNRDVLAKLFSKAFFRPLSETYIVQLVS